MISRVDTSLYWRPPSPFTVVYCKELLARLQAYDRKAEYYYEGILVFAGGVAMPDFNFLHGSTVTAITNDVLEQLAIRARNTVRVCSAGA